MNKVEQGYSTKEYPLKKFIVSDVLGGFPKNGFPFDEIMYEILFEKVKPPLNKILSIPHIIQMNFFVFRRLYISNVIK